MSEREAVLSFAYANTLVVVDKLRFLDSQLSKRGIILRPAEEAALDDAAEILANIKQVIESAVPLKDLV